MHIAKKFYGNPELSMKIEVKGSHLPIMYDVIVYDVVLQRFALEKLQLLLQDHPTFDDSMGDIGTRGREGGRRYRYREKGGGEGRGEEI